MNVNVSVQSIIYVKKFVQNPSACLCENVKYLASTMDDSVIACDEVIELQDGEIKAIPTNFNEII